MYINMLVKSKIIIRKSDFNSFIKLMQLKFYNTLTRQKEDFIPLMQDPNVQGEKKQEV